MEAGEFVRFRCHPAAPEVGLLHARYLRHAFARHAHPTYTLGVLEHGAEELRYGGDREYAGAGALVLINPEVVHTGRAVDEGGWAYRAAYLPVEFVRSIIGAAPPLTERIVDDPALARELLVALRAVEQDTATADGLLSAALARVFTRYGGPVRPSPAPGKLAVVRARDILSDNHLAPPSLGELAASLDTSQYALLRAFREAYGLPPHSYLTQYRVRKACALIRRGAGLAEAAVAVGFVDQAHLSRHFRKILGITPGQYRRAVQERTRSARRPPA